MLRGGDQPFEIVSDHAFENYFDAELIELIGEIEGIRIGTKRREQFGADCNDLGVHG